MSDKGTITNFKMKAPSKDSGNNPSPPPGRISSGLKIGKLFQKLKGTGGSHEKVSSGSSPGRSSDKANSKSRPGSSSFGSYEKVTSPGPGPGSLERIDPVGSNEKIGPGSGSTSPITSIASSEKVGSGGSGTGSFSVITSLESSEKARTGSTSSLNQQSFDKLLIKSPPPSDPQPPPTAPRPSGSGSVTPEKQLRPYQGSLGAVSSSSVRPGDGVDHPRIIIVAPAEDYYAPFQDPIYNNYGLYSTNHCHFGYLVSLIVITILLAVIICAWYFQWGNKSK